MSESVPYPLSKENGFGTDSEHAQNCYAIFIIFIYFQVEKFIKTGRQ
jgi:hypothetical protein